MAAAFVAARPATAQIGGVSIDADGVVRSTSTTLSKADVAALKKSADALPEDLRSPAERRFVSLKGVLTPDADRMTYALGGLTRIDVVIADADAGDVLIAGPAEPWAESEDGRLRGVETGRAVISKDDLILAFRHVAERGTPYGCSIDVTPDGVTRLTQFLAKNSRPASAAVVKSRYSGMAKAVGMQAVSVFGVDPDSPLAVAAVDADLVMKEIALGKRRSGVRQVTSHLSMLKPNGNNLQRWWFAPKYDAVETDESRTTFTLSGPRLKLLAQDEIADGSGVRHDAAVTRETTERFAKQFSEHMDAVALAQPSVARLQNVTDLLVVAALFKQEGLASVGFDPLAAALTLDPPPPVDAPPKSVPAAAVTRRSGGLMLGLIGGVSVNPAAVAGSVRGGGPSVAAPPMTRWHGEG